MVSEMSSTETTNGDDDLDDDDKKETAAAVVTSCIILWCWFLQRSSWEKRAEAMAANLVVDDGDDNIFFTLSSIKRPVAIEKTAVE